MLSISKQYFMGQVRVHTKVTKETHDRKKTKYDWYLHGKMKEPVNENKITDANKDGLNDTDSADNLAFSVESVEDSDDDLGRDCPERWRTKQTVVPYEDQNNPPVFGSVNVTNSSEVHFGNKTVFNGPVTIKQVIGDIENNGYVKIQDEIVNNSRTIRNERAKDRSGVSVVADSVKRIIGTKQLLIALLSIAIIASLITIVTVSVQRGMSGFPQSSEPPDQNTSVEEILDSKLRYVTRTEWIAQPPSEVLDQLTLPVPMVIIAHTATENCTNQSGCVLMVRTIQTFHIESRNWSDIAYNFLIGGDGSAYVGRGWDQVGAHTKFYNVKSIGIAFIGTFNSVRPPKRQLLAAQHLIEDGVALGKISKDYKLYGHRQFVPFLSPGNTLYAIIKEWPHWANDRPDMSQ